MSDEGELVTSDLSRTTARRETIGGKIDRLIHRGLETSRFIRISRDLFGMIISAAAYCP